jgi:uncharacterized membrane protein
MEEAIVLIVIVVIAIFIIPIVIASNSNSKISNLNNEILSIKNYLKGIHEALTKTVKEQTNVQGNEEIAALKQLVEKLNTLIEQQGIPVSPPQQPISDTLKWQRPEQPKEEVPVVIPDIVPAIIKEPIKEETPVVEPVQEVVEPDELENRGTSESPEEQEPAPFSEPEPEIIFAEPELTGNSKYEPAIAAIQEIKPPIQTPQAPVPPKKKTDFEQFIGEKLISIVGITILVLGIFFSVKWAIDRHLISDAGKIMIGIVSGTILLGVAHKLAKNYRAFSSILAGGGIAVLYFSIYEAYQAYHLIPQTAAFGIMVFITLITVILSIIYDKKELAIIAIVGGFGTPFFVSNGSGNYQVLFTYLLILNVGMFLLANFKKWNLINIICYGLTIFIFGGWVSSSFEVGKGHAIGGMLFISLFFLTFFGMHIIYNLRHQRKFGYTEIVLLLSNSFIYLGFGLYFLSFIQHGKYQGMFTLALSAFNFIFAYVFYRRKTIDKNLVYLLIGMVLTFLSLTGPLQLDGNYITLFWACELVVMYWMGTKTGIELLKNASILILVLTIISLIMDWNNAYFALQINIMPVLLNKAFITSAVVGLAIFLNGKLLQKDAAINLVWGLVPKLDYTRVLTFLLVVLAYLSLHLEVRYQSFARTGINDFKVMMLWNYHLVFVVVLAFVVSKRKSANWTKVMMALLAASLVIYPLGIFSVMGLRNELLPTRNLGLFYWHYFMPVFAMIALGMLISFVNKNFRKTEVQYVTMAWVATVLIILTLSVEVVHLWVLQSFQIGFSIQDIATRADKVALPIIWSICSLILMLLGMRHKNKTLRIISLTLFSLTIVKLFLYDISNVGQGGKIAAFIILGIILLIVSFMYQKIKGLFTEDDKKEAE